MKISKSTLTCLVSEGRLTLQVPQYTIHIGGVEKPGCDDMMDIPDDWLMELKGRRPVIGRESGYTFFSPKGYIEFKGELEKVLKESSYPGPWSDFEKYAEEFFAEVRLKSNKNRDLLRVKLLNAEQVHNTLFKLKKNYKSAEDMLCNGK